MVGIIASTEKQKYVAVHNGSSDVEKGPRETHHRCQHEDASTNPDSNPDFPLIRLIGRIVLDILKKFWAVSTAACLAILLLYWLYGGFLAFLMLCFAVSGVLYQVGDWLLYYPDQPPHSRIYVASPQILGLPFENHFLRTKDGVSINAVLIRQQGDCQARAPTVLFVHGNAGNIGHRLVNMKGLHHFCGCNILLLEYRGYGHSGGSPSEEGLYLDAQAGLDFLLSLNSIDRKKIVVFGRSLGGAVAVDLACRPEYSNYVMAVVLENTFSSIPEVARVLFNLRIVKLLPEFCYKNKYDTRKKIVRLTRPTLFLSGLADALIPPTMMLQLYQSSGSAMKRIARFESGTHNETWQCGGYYQTISLFLDDVIVSRTENSADSNSSSSSIQVPLDVI